MKASFAAALTLAAIGLARAQTGPSPNCVPGVTGIPIFGLTATVGPVGDYTLSCTNTADVGLITGLTFDYFMNVAELNTGPWTLTEGLNTYPGTLVLSNLVEFTGVLYDTHQPTLSFELHGVEVNPGIWPHPFDFREFLTQTGPITLAISTPDQLVAQNPDAPEPPTFILAILGALAFAARARPRKSSARSINPSVIAPGTPTANPHPVSRCQNPL